MKIKVFVPCVTTLCFYMLHAAIAVAQNEDTPNVIPEDAEGVKADAETGWNSALKLSANFSLSHNKNVPSTSDGTSMQFGYLILGGLDYLSQNKNHEWTNLLLWELGYTRTPAVDAMIKSLDNIDYKTTYLYHLPKLQWLGPFVSAQATTSMLRSHEIRADAVNVIRLKPGEEQIVVDGVPMDDTGAVIGPNHTSVSRYQAGKKIFLTYPFEPTILKQSAGLFAIPIDKTEFKLDIRLGLGAWETLTNGGHTVQDNEDTADFLELRQLQNSYQAGMGLGVIMKGDLKDNVKYSLSALAMQPFWHEATTDLEGIELLNVEFEALLGIKVFKFMSIDYSFKAYKRPLIVEDWQVQNSLLVSINFDLVHPKKVPPKDEDPCKDCPKPSAAEKPVPQKTAAEESPTVDTGPTPPPTDAQSDAEASPANETASPSAASTSDAVPNATAPKTETAPAITASEETPTTPPAAEAETTSGP